MKKRNQKGLQIMKISKWKAVCAVVLTSICMIILCDIAYASEDNYTTITVDATDDESGVYMYAIDSTEDSAWQESNIFYVLPDTMHTVYVKDAAGNITSSEVYAEAASTFPYIDNDTNSTMYEEYYSDSEPAEAEDPYEAGVGTGAGSGTITDYVNDDSKEYYTITTKNGNNFYLIIDHRNSDSNVYFTKPVSELDLLTLAAEAGEVEEADLEQVKVEEAPVIESEKDTDNDGNKSKSIGEYLPMIVFVILLCGSYYYYMVYKKKKAIAEEYDEEAADMEQFIPVEDDEDAALFAYKGNRASAEEEDDMDSILDEFYENNSETDDFETELEEDYGTGILDDFDTDDPVIESGEKLSAEKESYSTENYDDDLEEDDM